MGKVTNLKSWAAILAVFGSARAGIGSLNILTEGQNMSRKLILIGLLSIFVLAPAPLRAGAELSYYRYYFKEKQPLELDLSRIAVLERGERLAKSRFAEFAIADEDIEPWPIKRWSLARTPTGARTSEGIEQLVAAMGKEKVADFISPVFVGEGGGPVIITQEICMRFQKGVDAEKAESILEDAKLGTILDRNWGNRPGAYRLRSRSRNGFEVLAMANALAERPEVKFAEPDFILTGRGALIPDDPYFPECWGIHNTGQSGGTVDMDMDGPEAWDVTTGDPCVIVVIFDCGVDQDHPDINQRAGKDFTGEGGGGGPVNEFDNHGTAVAGCVSAVINNDLGTVGIAPNCLIASARVYITLDNNNNWTGESSWMVAALGWAETIGARVTNNSNVYDPPGPSDVADEYESTRTSGIVHFAAAGNQGQFPPRWPASLPTVNAVGAITRYGQRWPSSNFGLGLAFCAPGVSIWTTDRTGSAGYDGGDYHLGTGTSYASPYAAGVAALVLSCNPSLSPDQVERRMQQGCVDLGDSGKDWYYGWGLVNAYNSLFAYYVDDDAPDDPGPADPTVSDPNEDGSIYHPFDAIQEAIAAASDGETIVVLDGTYTGTGNEFLNFGGKAITVRSKNGADVTIIHCEWRGQGGSGGGFYFGSGEGADSVVDGFTIRNADLYDGGGIYCRDSSPTIANCIIRDNRTVYSGGGIYCDNSSPTIINCRISGNRAVNSNGGGIHCYSNSSPTIINCRISGNTTGTGQGGGIYCGNTSSPTITNCMISGNRASQGSGGGIYCWDNSSPTLTNCSFSDNLAFNGGGMFNRSWSSPTLANSIFWGNTAFFDGPQIALADNSNVGISYCDLQGGPTAIYKDGTSSILWGFGNINLNPLLTADGHLRPGSPCIDAGANGIVPADTADIDGDGNTTEPIPWDFDSHPRFVDDPGTFDTGSGVAPIVDIGADEFPYLGDFNFNGCVNFLDYAIFALAWSTEPGDAEWNPDCDISRPADNSIDMLDLAVFVDNWLAAALVP